MARPSKFNAALSERILALYDKGKTDSQVAKIIGVSERCLYYWKTKNPEFMQAIREHKAIADDLVEASLFQRAIGYTFEEEKIFQWEGQIIRAKTKKHIPPDVKAQMFWLMNRKSDDWRVPKEEPIKNNPEKENGPQVVLTLPSNGRENPDYIDVKSQDVKEDEE